MRKKRGEYIHKHRKGKKTNPTLIFSPPLITITRGSQQSKETHFSKEKSTNTNEQETRKNKK